MGNHWQNWNAWRLDCSIASVKLGCTVACPLTYPNMQGGYLFVALSVVGNGLTKSEQTHDLGLHTKFKQNLTMDQPSTEFQRMAFCQRFWIWDTDRSTTDVLVCNLRYEWKWDMKKKRYERHMKDICTVQIGHHRTRHGRRPKLVSQRFGAEIGAWKGKRKQKRKMRKWERKIACFSFSISRFSFHGSIACIFVTLALHRPDLNQSRHRGKWSENQGLADLPLSWTTCAAQGHSHLWCYMGTKKLETKWNKHHRASHAKGGSKDGERLKAVLCCELRKRDCRTSEIRKWTARVHRLEYSDVRP